MVIKPGYYIGVDGGGTKTKAVIATEEGIVVGKGDAGGANPHNIPLDIAYENILTAIKNAASNALQVDSNFNCNKCMDMCIGLAGIDTTEDLMKVSRFISETMANKRLGRVNEIVLCNDGFVGLKSATDNNWGICLIASTGSNCYGLNAKGIQTAAGDWGYLLGDKGSAYALGLKMLNHVVEEYDGRKPLSILTPEVLRHLKLQHPTDLISWMYSGQVPVKEIASLSLLLNNVEIEQMSDISIFENEAIEALTNAYKAVVQKLDLWNMTYSTVLVGGLFKLQGEFTQKVEQKLQIINPNAEIIRSDVSPAEGAVKVALMPDKEALINQKILTLIKV